MPVLQPDALHSDEWTVGMMFNLYNISFLDIYIYGESERETGNLTEILRQR